MSDPYAGDYLPFIAVGKGLEGTLGRYLGREISHPPPMP